MKENITHARTCVYNCNYHMVFSTKYRKAILNHDIEKIFKEILMEIAKEKNFIVRACEVGNQDHIHIFVSAHPKIAPGYIVKMIKGITARKIFIKEPKIKENLWNGHLWNPSYYIETIGSISSESILQYIEKQSK